jgi:hypothetical protein
MLLKEYEAVERIFRNLKTDAGSGVRVPQM